MNEQSNARFQIKDARITRVKELPKVCFLTVMVQAGKYPDYHDITLFQPAAFPLEEGTAVTISGELQKRKPKEGEREWKLQLVARKVERGDDEKAPRPRSSGERQRRAATPKESPPVDESDDLIF
jgi:hypothetical protein